MPEQLTNPYHPPALEPQRRSIPLAGPIEFRGCLSLDEACQADKLLRPSGKPPQPPKAIKFRPLLDILAVVALGWMLVDAYVHDDTEYFYDLFLGLAIVGVIWLATYYGPRYRWRKLVRMRERQQGLFTVVRGEVHADGVRYFGADDRIPLEYEWADFVGARISEDIALLYVDYPASVNPIAASYFHLLGEWRLVKDAIENNLTIIPKHALPSRYRGNEKTTLLAQGANQLDRQDWPRAVNTFMRLLAIDSDNLQALRGHASSSCMQGDFVAALASVDRLLETHPDEPSIERLRVTCLLGLERFDDALQSTAQFLDKHGADIDMLAMRSTALARMERHQESLTVADEILQLDPENAFGLNNRGKALIELGRPLEAIPDLERAVALAPDLPNPSEHLRRAVDLVAEADFSAQ